MTIDSLGTILDISVSSNPDSLQGVEFYPGIIIPGMVNCHTHLELSYLKGAIAAGQGFAGFAAGMRENRGKFSNEQISSAADYYDSKMWAEGISAVADISNSDVTFPIKAKSSIYYHSFLEVYGLGISDLSQIRIVEEKAEAASLNYSVTPHSMYSLNEQMLKQTLSHGKDGMLSLHLMESVEEQELFSRRGEMYDWYQRAGFATDFIGKYSDPCDRLMKSVPPDRKLLVVHNTRLSNSMIGSLDVYFGTNATFVVCPASNEYISGARPPVDLLSKRGVRIAFGTDSLASNTRLSMVEEMKKIDWPDLHEMLQWATINGAEALGLEKTLGSIEIGKKPGLVLLQGIDWDTLRLKPSAKTERLV